jgi:Spy/CpxP family protein refolding chaperone
MKKILLFVSMIALGSSQLIAQPPAGAGRMQHGQMHGKQMMAGKMAKDLNLTEDQKAQLKKVHQEYGAKIKAIKDNDQLTQGDARKQIAALHEAQKAASDKVFTEAQKAKLKDMQEQRRGRIKEEAAANVARMQVRLGLTEAQVAKVKAEQAGMQSKMQALRNNKDLSKEQKKEQIQALMKAHKTNMASILTPEQQQKMQQGRRWGKGEAR